jgi:hypothetical protein
MRRVNHQSVEKVLLLHDGNHVRRLGSVRHGVHPEIDVSHKNNKAVAHSTIIHVSLQLSFEVTEQSNILLKGPAYLVSVMREKLEIVYNMCGRWGFILGRDTHTMIDLTGCRSRDLLRIRRALYRLTEKA